MTGVYRRFSVAQNEAVRDSNTWPKVLGVLSGTDLAPLLFAAWVADSDVILAADGAAGAVVRAGKSPDVTIGDLDSLPPHLRESLPGVLHDPDQERTDVDKLLAHALGYGRSITLIATEGDLPDHVLATYHSAVSAEIGVRFAFRRGIGWILRDGEVLTVPVNGPRRVSVIPLQPARVTLEGVQWPLQNAQLALGKRVSISNRSTGDGPVMAAAHGGAALLFVEHAPEEMPRWHP